MDNDNKEPQSLFDKYEEIESKPVRVLGKVVENR